MDITLDFPVVPDTPIRAFSENGALLREFSPRRYFVFAQYFTSVSMIKYLQEILALIRTYRTRWAQSDCNYDAMQIRSLGAAAFTARYIIEQSKNVEFAEKTINGLLYNIHKFYWTVIKKYLPAELSGSSDDYLAMLLVRSKTEFNSDDIYKNIRGGNRGTKNRKKNCTYKRRCRK